MTLDAGRIYTVNSRKYDGAIRRSWKCELVSSDEEKIDLIGSFEGSVEHPDLGQIEAGTISHERFYLNRWYNFFIFKTPSGSFRNYYVNICMPPRIDRDIIDYVDLDIDLIVWPDGRCNILDLDEFAQNSTEYGYPAETIAEAIKTLNELERVIRDSGADDVVNLNLAI